MAKKVRGLTEPEIESRDLDRLNELLKESFAGLKRDMSGLQEKNNAQYVAFQEVHKQLAGIRRDYVPHDKFNVVRVRVGQLSEDMRRMARAENAIRKLDKITAKKQALENKIQGMKRSLASSQDNNAAELADMKEQLLEEVQTLAAETNHEFALVKKDLGLVESKGGKVVDKRLTAFKKDFTRMAADLKANVRKYREENASFVKKQQIDVLLKEVNQEFDDAKENIQYLAEQVVDMEKNLSQAQKLAKGNQGLHGKVQTTHTNLQKLKEAMGKDVDMLKKNLKDIKEKLDMETGSLREISNTKQADMRKPVATPMKSGRGLTIASTVVITISFLLLITAAVIFLATTGKQQIIDGFIISAVIVFVIGILMRVLAAVR